MRGAITALYGVAVVMYVAGWVSIATGKGINVPCVVVGIMASGAASALAVQHWVKAKR